MSEDCLTLNVFRPSEPVVSNETLVPVMLWIYGGSFDSGVAADYGANNVIAQSVLRVGLFTFAAFLLRLILQSREHPSSTSASIIV